MHKKRMTVAEQIRPYDSNVDYVLTEGEFHRLLDGLGFQLDDAEVRHILHLIDLEWESDDFMQGVGICIGA